MSTQTFATNKAAQSTESPAPSLRLRRRARLLLAAVVLVLVGLMAPRGTVRADFDSRGTDFWVAFPANTSVGANNVYLYVVSATSSAHVVVTFAPAAYSQTWDFTAVGELHQFVLPATTTTNGCVNAAVPETPCATSVDVQDNDTVVSKGIHIVSSSATTSALVTVYGLSSGNQSVDGFLGLPTSVLGKEYFVAGYSASDATVSPNIVVSSNPTTTADSGSEFVVVAADPTTTSANATTLSINLAITVGSHLAGVPFSVTLNNPGDSYVLRAPAGAPDLTGSIVTSTKSVAVFSGDRCSNIPVNAGACDNTLEELLPTSAWGKHFISVPFATKTAGDRFRIVGSVNGTNITINSGANVTVLVGAASGVPGTSTTLASPVHLTVNRGTFAEFILTASAEITTDQPAEEMQFMHSRKFDVPAVLNSDPSMMTIVPNEQFQSDYTISTPSPANPTFDANSNWVNLVVPNDQVGQITLDSAPIAAAQYAAIGTNFSTAQVLLPAVGSHRFTSSAGRPFGIYAYGFAAAASYAYPGGMFAGPIATVKTITLTVTSATKYVGQQACVQATAFDNNQAGVQGVRVDFSTSVTGAVGSMTTDATGNTQPTFCYTGTTAGTETVTASVGTVQGSGTVTWLPRPVIATVTANNKVYDGTPAATIASCTLTELLSGFSGSPVGVSCSALSNGGTFTTSTTPFPSDVNVANGKRVLSNALSLGGTLASNFTFTLDNTASGTPTATQTATTTANITPIPLDVTITAADKPYDGTNTATITGCTLSATPGGPAIVAGDTPTCTASGGTFSDANVGTGKTVTAATVTIQGNPNGNYSASVISTTTANITPQTLTVTPNAATRLYGAANPAFTYTITGFVHSETVAVVTGTPTLSTTAVTSSPVGVYPIQAAGTLTATNYVFNYATGPLTITPAPLTVAADPKAKVYGTSDPALTYQVGGLVAPDTAGGVLTGSLTRAAGETVSGGPYAILQGSVALTSSNYTLSFTGNNLTITPAPLTVNADAKTKVYGSADPTLTYQTTGLVSPDTASTVLTGLLTRTAGESVAGPYPIAKGTVALTSSNYTLTFNGSTLTITPAPLTVTADAKTKVYGSSDPSLTYQVAGLQFSDTASVVTGSLARTAGESVLGGPYPISQGSVALTSSNYTLTFVGNNLTITPAVLTVTAPTTSKLYGAAVPSLSASTTVTGFVNGDIVATAFTGIPATTTTATASSPVGSYPTTATQGSMLSTNYTFTFVNGTLTITPAVLTITAPSTSKVYGAAVPSLVATVAGFVNGDTPGTATTGLPSVTTTATASSPVGSDPITAAAGNLVAPNYSFQFVGGTLSITPAALSVTANNKSRAFGAANPTLDGVLTGVVNGDNITASYSTTAITTSPIGTYPITATLVDPGTKLGNYTVTNTPGTLTVTAAPVTATVTALNKIYDGTTTASGACALSVVDVNLTCSFTTETFDTATVGNTKTVTATGITLGGTDAAEYTLANTTATTTANVTPVTLTVKANDASRVYGAANPTFSAGITGFIPGENASVVTGAPAFATPATTGSNIGSYAITPSIGNLAATNYTFVFANGTLTVTQAPLSVTANNKSRMFDVANPTLDGVLTGVVNGDNITASYSTTATLTSPIGGYPITATLNDPGTKLVNYTVANTPGTLTVMEPPVTVTITAANKPYDGTPSASATCALSVVDPNLTCSFVTATFANATVGVGKTVTATGITIGGSDAADYSLTNTTATTTAAITPLVLTVKANDTTKVYGAANPTFSAGITGFLAGETIAVVTGAPGFSTPATTSSVVASYAITPSIGNLTATNYTFAFANGTLTITPALLTVTADNASKLFGAPLPALTATITGFVNGDGLSAVSGSPALTTTATQTSPLGTYPIVAGPGNLAAANYTFAFVNGLLTVGSMPVTVSIKATSKIYDGTNSAIATCATSIVDPNLTCAFAPATFGDANVGTGKTVTATGIVLGGTSASQYTLGNTTATTTANIIPAPLTITAEHKTKVYDGLVFDPLTATYAGFIAPDGVASLPGALAFSGAATTAVSVGNGYVITPGGFGPGRAVATLAGAEGEFTSPSGVAVDASGNVYVADATKNQIFVIDATTHLVSVLAGNGTPGNVDDAAGNAEFHSPAGVAVDAAGNVYVADSGNNSVRMIAASTHVVTTIATGFSAPRGLAIDAAGNIYVADTGNNVIAEIAAGTHVVSTLAGTAGTFGDTDGAAAIATFAAPAGVAVDAAGNVYVADSNNNAIRVIAAGTHGVSTLANGFNAPNGVAVDAAGTVYVADTLHNTISFMPSGTNTPVTIAGDGHAGDVDGAPMSAEFKSPSGIAVDAHGIVYIADANNATVRTLTDPADGNYTIAYVNNTLDITPAPLTITASSGTKPFGTTFTVTPGFTGFVNGETSTNLATVPTCTSLGTPASAAASATPYVTSCSDAVDANYSITYVPGTLTVTDAPLTASVTAIDKVYDGTTSATGACVLSPLVSALTCAFTTETFGDPNVANGKTVTATGITLGGANASDYTLNNVTATTTANITPAPLTITASSASVTFGDAVPAVTPSYAGFVPGDSSTSLTTAPTCTTTYTATTSVTSSPVGTSCNGAVDPNYTITYVPGKVTIVKKTVTISVPPVTTPYSGTPVPTSCSVSDGLIGTLSYTGTGYGPSATAPTAAGVYTATCTVPNDPNYTVPPASGTVTITAVALTITASSASVTFGDAVPAVTPSYAGFVPGDSSTSLTTAPTCTTTYTATTSVTSSPVGTSCNGAVDPNYTITYVPGKVTIVKKTVTISVPPVTTPYSGTPVPTSCSVSDGLIGTLSYTGTGYGPSATAPTAAGVYTATCTVPNDPNYTVPPASGTVTITAVALTITASSASVTFGDAVPAVTPSYAGFVPGDSSTSLTTAPTCTTTYTATTSVTSSPVGTSCNGAVDPNYTITYVPGKVTIVKKTVTISVPPVTTPYSGTPVPTSCSVSDGLIGTLSYTGTGYGPSATAPTAAGVYTATCTVPNDPNYTVPPASGTVTITAVALTITASSASVTFGDAVPAVTPSYAGFVPGDSSTSLTTAPTCTTTYTATTSVTSSPVGTSCNGAVDPNYTITYVPGKVTIVKKTVTISVPPVTTPYSGTPVPTSCSVSDGLIGTLSYTGTGYGPSATAPTAAGVYTATCTVPNDPNYTVPPASGTVTITAVALTITASSASVTFGDAVPAVTPSYAGFVPGDSSTSLTTAPTCTTTYTATTSVTSSPVGTSCNGAVDPNYTITYVPGKVTIVKKTVTISVPPVTTPYSGTPVPTSCSVSDGLIGTLSYTGTGYGPSATAPTAAGVYTATCTVPNDPNYTVPPASGTVTITAVALTITASSASVTFGDAVPAVTPSYAGFVPGDSSTSLTTAPTCTTTYTATTSVTSSPVGTSCNGAVDPNYTITYVPGKVTIVKKTVTISVPPVTTPYSGTPVPTSCSVSDGLIGTLSYTGTGYGPSATAPTAAGVYTATCTVPNDPNYTVPPASGTVTITAVALTITASSASVVYGAAAPVVTPSYAGFVPGDSSTSLETAPTCATTYTATTSVTSSPVGTSCNGAVDPNYTITYVPGKVTIVKKTVTISVPPVTTPYSGTPVPTSCSVSDGLIGTLSYTSSGGYGPSATAPTAAGVYTATCTVPNDPNYTVPPASGTVTITAVALTITASSASVVYGAAAPVVTPSYAGFVPGDSSTSLETAPTCATTYTATTPVGSAPTTTCSGAVDPNYTITYKPGAVTIADAPLTATVTASDKVYNGTTGAAGTCVLTPLVAGLSCTFTTETFGDPNVGTGKTVTATGITLVGTNASDYTLGNTTATTTASITPAPLTVTASSASVTYGDATPTVTPSYTGFVGGESKASLTTAPTCTTSYSATTPVANSPVATTCSGAVDANYAITYVPGAVTVNRKALTVVANSKDKQQGAANPVLDGTLTGVIASDGITATYSTTATVLSAAGTYPITPALVDPNGRLANYVVTSTNGTLTVLGQPAACAISYPFSSSVPRTSVVFNESEVLRGFAAGTDGTIRVWYSDEHAMSLGVRQVSVKTSSGTTVTNYDLSPLSTNPGSVAYPSVGSTAVSGDQAAIDPYGRPIYPSLFITDITANATSTSGDWQYGGTAIAPHAVFGTWKGASMLVDETSSTPSMTVTVDADPSQNSWSLGTGSDAPPSGLTNEGYGTEVRWNLNNLLVNGQPLQEGHTYRLQFMVHDGDQNKAGGDVGQACMNVVATGLSSAPALKIMKSVDKATAAPGDTLTYTINYSNVGASGATNVVVTDVLPAQATFLSATGGGTNAAGTITWPVGTLAPGSTGSVTLTVQLDATFPSGTTNVTNTATAASVNLPTQTASSSVTTAVTSTPVTGSSGVFVIGDLDAIVGNHVTFWGAQWEKANSLSGGPSPAAFKGFANTTSTVPPSVGGTWTTAPGNSAPPPASVPSLLTVIVSSLITQSGPTIAGNIPCLAVVKTDSGYAPDPGHAGTGTIVSLTCAPVATNNSYTTVENTLLTVSSTTGVLTGDSDNDGGALTAAIVSKPSHGTVTLNANGSFTYTPASNFVGTDTFTYQAIDGVLTSNVATVTITVTQPPCTGPVAAKNDSYSTYKNTTLTIAAPGVLTNDTDPQHDPLTASLVSTTKHGTLTLNANGSFVFVPTAGFAGTDTFTYQVSDGSKSDTATVTITVTDRAPVAANNTYTTVENTALTVSATTGVLTGDSDADGDSLTAAIVAKPAHGTVTLNANGSFTYTPANNFTGTDTFTYQANDGTLASNTATVTITVTQPPCTGPVAAKNDSYSTFRNTTLTIAAAGVLANDTDPQHDPLTASLVSTTKHGVLTLNANGGFVYVPTTGFAGTDTFTYQVSDGSKTDTATVTINVTDRAPVAANNNTTTYATPENTSLTVPATSGVLIGATDPDGDSLTAVLTQKPGHGTVTLNSDGSFVYAPANGFTGNDNFGYQASDGLLTSNQGQVTINVLQPPQANNDNYTTNRNTVLTASGGAGPAAGVLANDQDPQHLALTASVVVPTSHGTLVLAANGGFTYTPAAGFAGTDTFTYKANDGQQTSNTATVTITVTDRAPVAANNNATTYTTPANTALTVPATTGVLVGATDPDGDSLTAVLAQNPGHGMVTLNSNGSFVYTPASGFTGNDNFNYQVSDGILTSNGQVTINVLQPPQASNDNYTMNRNTVLTASGVAAPGGPPPPPPAPGAGPTPAGVLANDQDPQHLALTAVVVVPTSHGTLVLAANGGFIYTPAAGFAGTDTFTYKANDGQQTSNTATVTITVK